MKQVKTIFHKWEFHTILCKVVGTLMTCTLLLSQAEAQTLTEHPKQQTMSIKNALVKVKNKFGYSIWFSTKDINLNEKVTVDLSGNSIDAVLKRVLANQPLRYEIKDKIIRIYPLPTAELQGKNNATKQITGKILDANDGTPLIGSTIRVVGKKNATITDINGAFTIDCSPSDQLEISYIGYTPLITKRISMFSGNSYIIRLEPSNNLLDEVVVTGYQTVKKFNMTGSVNTLTPEKISLQSSNTMSGLLEGSIPGLSVYKGNYRIRGGASLNAGNSPLIIVDDFEVESVPENLDEIESITILKDAAATAIWGSRASNGVIVINTKKGRINDFRISYAGNLTIGSKPDPEALHKLNSRQLVDYDKEVFMKGYYFPGFFDYETTGYSLSQEIIKDYLVEDLSTLTPEQLSEMNARFDKLAQQDNREQIRQYLLRNSMRQNHLLSISGGSERVNYYISGSFTGSNSAYIGDQYNSVNINSRTSYKILPRLTLRSDINATFDKSNNGYNLSGEVYSLYPFQMLVDESGNRVQDFSGFNHTFADQMVKDYGYYSESKNLLDEVDLSNNHSYSTNYKVRIGTDFRIIEGLNISADYQYQKILSETKNIRSEHSFAVRDLINSMAIPDDNKKLTYHLPQGDILDHSQSNIDAWILKVGTTLNRTFGTDNQHYINGAAGFEMRSRHSNGEGYRKFGYNDQLLSWKPYDAVAASKYFTWWNGNYKIYPAGSDDWFSDNLNREISYYASGIYTYDKRYTVSASMRIDRSNLFGVSSKYRNNPIWSVGANWNIKNEKFFHFDPISTLMLRASWGLTGNFDRSGSTTPVMVASKRYLSAIQDYVVRLQTPPNPYLRWERTRSINLSTDIGFFNRVNATVTYYDNKSYDLLGNQILDPTVGYSQARINAAGLTNKGIEIQLDATLVKHKDFTWNINWVYAYNTNKITDNKIPDTTPWKNRVTGTTIFLEDYPRESLWSYRWGGLDEKGEPRVYTNTGELLYDVSKLTADDLEFSGTYTPKHTGSLSTGMRYKQLSANVQFTYNFGHVFRIGYPSMNPYETSPMLSDKVATRWMKSGDEAYTDIPGIPNGMDFFNLPEHRGKAVQYSSNSVRSGNMIRLREILLNYELPVSFLRKTPLRRLSLTMQLNNVWLWTQNKEHVDPEAVNPITGRLSLPRQRTMTFGLKADF